MPSCQSLRPVVRMTFGFARRFADFCSSDPVVKCNCPWAYAATSGVTCGRPSARTVDNQNSSADWIERSVSAQVIAVALGSLYR